MPICITDGIGLSSSEAVATEASKKAGSGDDGPPTDMAARGRLRRFCEEKAGGRLQVPEWLHNKWKADQTGLLKVFQECGYDKDPGPFPCAATTYASICLFPIGFIWQVA